jgi:hypothetical protein
MNVVFERLTLLLELNVYSRFYIIDFYTVNCTKKEVLYLV